MVKNFPNTQGIFATAHSCTIPAVESCVYNSITSHGPIFAPQSFSPEISDRFTCRVKTFTCDSGIASFPMSLSIGSKKVYLTYIPLTFSSFRPFIPSALHCGWRMGTGPSLGSVYPNRALGLKAISISALKTSRLISRLAPTRSPLFETAIQIHTFDFW